MTRFKERHQRWVCRAAFLGLCLLPTLGVITWTLARHMPGYVRGHEDFLSQLGGLSVSLSSVSHPQPRSTWYQGLQFVDDRTGETVFSADKVESRWTDERLVVVIRGARLSSSGLFRLAESLPRSIGGCDAWPVRLLAAELVIEESGMSHTIRDLRGDVMLGDGGRRHALSDQTGESADLSLVSTASIDFLVAGKAMQTPAQIRVCRTHWGLAGSTEIECDTGGAALPCSLLAPFISAVGKDSRESCFRGYLWVRHQQGEGLVEAEYSGEFSQVDLDGLVSNHFPHRLSGQAQILIDRAVFRDGRLTEAAGLMRAGPGVISRSLVAGAADALYLIANPLYERGDLVISYDRLALHFQINEDGLQLFGACRNAPRGTILTSRGAIVLKEPTRQPLPVVALVRALVPRAEYLVPMTRETDLLTRLLPLPSLVAKDLSSSEELSTARQLRGDHFPDR